MDAWLLLEVLEIMGEEKHSVTTEPLVSEVFVAHKPRRVLQKKSYGLLCESQWI